MFLCLSELKKLSKSKALNEMKFVCGICHKKFIISGSRTIEGKIDYYKTSNCGFVKLIINTNRTSLKTDLRFAALKFAGGD